MASSYRELAPRNPNSKTGRVWRLAEGITRIKGRRAARGEVIEAYVAEGGNPDTASTQYWHWKKAYEVEIEDSCESDHATRERPQSFAAAQLMIGTDGRVVIPAQMRNAMEIGSDGKLTVWVTDGELHMITLPVAIRRAQEMVRNAVPSGASLANELIAERRAEAQQDATP